MKAVEISGQAPGGKRARLADSLPLDTPFVLQIFPVYACNFKCVYCLFSVDKSKRGFISDKVFIDFDLYKKCVDDMKQFSDKIKVIRFVGIGEPLMHKKIADMVKYTVDSNVANIVEIITNGVLLTPAMSDALIAAGLKRMVISVQGVNQEKYLSLCGAKINFAQFLEYIEYYFTHKKADSQLYIKIVDLGLNSEEEEKKAKEIFGNICDTIAIEHTAPFYDAINYEPILEGRDPTVTQFGLPVSEVAICPQPFFQMQINPDGKVIPCFSWDYPIIIGDCNLDSVYNIWHSEKYKKFRRDMLRGIAQASDVCVGCNFIKYRLFPEDDLRHDVPRLAPSYEMD